MSRSMVEARGVEKRFGGFRALQGVDLEVQAGEVLVLCGPSGSGKSTLLRCLDGLERIDAGEIRIAGQRLDGSRAELRRLRSKVGMVFQSFNLFPHLTVRQNLVLGPVKVRGMPRDEAERLAFALLARVGIADKADSFPDTLSGGQQQRAAIARALCMRPEIMLFDEPTSSLDPEMIAEVLDVMRGLASEGMTMIVVTHEMGFAREVADRIAFMESGRIVELTSPTTFFTNPREDRARRFIGKILSH